MSRSKEKGDANVRVRPVTPTKDAYKNNIEFINGNTLDYYNDDLSRKAVGKLFDSREDDGEGYEGELGADTGEIGSFEKDSYVKGFERSKKLEKAETDNREGEDSGRAVPVKPEREPRVKNIEKADTSDNDEDYSFDFSMYRKKERNKSTVGAKPVPTRSHEQRVKKAVGIDDKADSKENQLKNENNDHNDFKEKYRSRDYIPSPKTSRPFKPGSASGVADGSESGLPIYRIAFIGICLIFLIILFVFVIRMNSLNTKLIETQNELKTITDSNDKVGDLTLELAGRDEKIDDLTAEITELKMLLSETSSQQPTAPDDATQTTQPPTQNQSSETDTYVVQSGDSFSKISKKLFGSERYATNIKEANGYSPSNDNIQPGQVLKIPKI